MSFFVRNNARFYYEEFGKGEPIIALHGLIENTAYWTLTGVADKLAENFRLISMEMRGHGRTVVDGEPRGFDIETMGDDLIAFADHLKIDRFHLLTHSTGGMIATRYAMKDCSRFASIVLTDTTSFTSFVNDTPEKIKAFHDQFASFFEKLSWEQMIAAIHTNSRPFFRGIAEMNDTDKREKMFGVALEIFKLNDRFVIAEFVRSFYNDPDQRVESLRKISCPVLIIYGEKDDIMIQPSKTMAKEIPGARILEYPGVGHMTAIEEPRRFADDIFAFYKNHPIT
jgi:pimeloyl-ACP methyl ester carboxylesterase